MADIDPRRDDTAAAVVPVLRLDRVTKRFGRHDTRVEALHEVSFDVHAGELVAVMGPSGSGKSTLVQVACGLAACDGGGVDIDGVRIGDDRRRWAELRRRRIGVVFQRLNLVPALTALENVMAPRLLDGAKVTEAREAALAALAEVGTEHLAALRPDELSGGQEQSVAIARAIVGDRTLLLADEPTGALDSVASDEVVRVLAGRAEAGAAVVLVTHDASLASWADRIVWLRDGVVVEPSSLADAGPSSSGGVR